MTSFKSVNVSVIDTATSTPLEGVTVRVMDPLGARCFTEGVTGPDGVFQCLLPTGDYALRTYKFACKSTPVGLLLVDEDQEPVVVDVQCTVKQPVESSDPRLCRLSGYFRDITGAPRPNLDIMFVGEFGPTILDNAGVLSETRSVRTDATGYACLDLIRCAKYSVVIEGYEDKQRTVLIPDLPGANLPAVLFAVVARVQYVGVPSSPLTLAVGERYTLQMRMHTNSGIAYPGPDTVNVQWRSSSTPCITIAPVLDGLEIRAVSPGVCTVYAERADKSIVVVPEEKVLPGSELQVTVV